SLRISCYLLLFSLTHPFALDLHTLALHDALPILLTVIGVQPATGVAVPVRGVVALLTDSPGAWVIVLLHTAEACCGVVPAEHGRSEEHTSELQSRFDLVCRLLLEITKLSIRPYAQ